MAHWTIEGSDACTGLPVSATIEAEDDGAATALAREHGIFVSIVARTPIAAPLQTVHASRTTRRRLAAWLYRRDEVTNDAAPARSSRVGAVS